MTCESKSVSVFKNDDTGAFRGESDARFIQINRPSGLADNVRIYKLELKIASLPVFTFGDGTEPIEFPIGLDLTANQTSKLSATNNCYVKVYDVNGLGQTCCGTITFNAKNEVV